MKFFFPFRTTLTLSRYLFRALALLLWLLGVLLTAFWIINLLHQKETALYQTFNTSWSAAQYRVRHASDIIRELKFSIENRLNRSDNSPGQPTVNQPEMMSTGMSESVSDCQALSPRELTVKNTLGAVIRDWKENFSPFSDVNRVVLFSDSPVCVTDFPLGSSVTAERFPELDALYRQLARNRSGDAVGKQVNVYGLLSRNQSGGGFLYTLAPLFIGDDVVGWLGVEQTLRLDDYTGSNEIPFTVLMTDGASQPLTSATSYMDSILLLDDIPDKNEWMGYTNDYRQLVIKKTLLPSSLNMLYVVESRNLFDKLKIALINALLLNLLSAFLFASLAWLLERRIFLPAENQARQLEENDQFNRKIVASAPAGICILRLSDGINLLSNELAHNYLTMLSAEDKKRLLEIIYQRQVSMVDVITTHQAHLQISFVHSRYRNENVAICVLIDVSARVKIEQALQEVAEAAEQASQSKSMFLATVSHELRTPLYGIIGNLDLLQTRHLADGVAPLVHAMSSASHLLLRIISDILDFSKIESEQLNIERQVFAPRELLERVTGSYLAMAFKKRLTLWLFIEDEVPDEFTGDPQRIEQIIANLLSNAIKFTSIGGIVLRVFIHDGYLIFQLRDSGKGIPAKDIVHLFNPFFQIGEGKIHHYQGTGLGLAICEKLVNLMDGDIQVESEPGIGSLFTVRLPCYQRRVSSPVSSFNSRCWLLLHNDMLAAFLLRELSANGVSVARIDDAAVCDEGIVITDHQPLISGSQALIWLRFATDYSGSPKQVSPGRWIVNSCSAHRISSVLPDIMSAEASSFSQHEILTSSAVGESQKLPGREILIVDDHPLNRQLLSEQVATLGYRVFTAGNGEEALAFLARHDVDLLLTDVNMPVMDGYQLTHALREKGSRMPVIAVTANALAEQRQQCIDKGMDDCLCKPVTLDTLEKTLSVYLTEENQPQG
ncbi:MAG: Sensor histidine kinase RcsC [Candidatus Erwinia impunctatus]